MIFSDNVRPSSYIDTAFANWTFFDLTGQDVTSPTVCAQESNTTVPVPPSILCYYGRQRVTVDDVVQFVGDPKVWWLQERTQNRWQAFDPVHPSPATPLVVTAVDWGDLLESSPSLNARQIRTEMSLLMDAKTYPEFAPYVAYAFDSFGQCDLAATPDGCFAAFKMSGAVPGTDQSINEIQGTDFGPGLGTPPGTRTFIDPTTVKKDKVTGNGYHATVYSGCARLVIQRLLGTGVSWDSTKGYWVGDAATPVVNIAAYSGTYSAEINAGGSMLYGYNWNAKTAATGQYRLTFVLDGQGQGKCPVPLNTVFGDSTYVANPGEVSAGVVVSKQTLDEVLGGDGSEGGLAYVDITLAAKGRKK